MSFNKWPKRSAEKNYFMVPNEIFNIGLDYREISLYTIRPIPGVLEAFYERQFRQAEEAAARYRAAELLNKSSVQSRQSALCAPFREEASLSPAQGFEGEFEPLSEEFARTIGFPPKPSEAGSVGEGGVA